MSIFEMMIWNRIERSLASGLDGAINEALENKIHELAPSVLSKRPNDHLTEGGWNLALIVAMQELWPDTPKSDAIAMLQDYVGAEYGDEGHEWTFSAARDLAREYVSEFGEVA
ncbi:hypothetical protein JET14_13540 [Martelella lutilitoris]|uniref:Uncharacterized protein n=1 Tax=Martelella lutilitoris TaxID=2583532 RepID=A0A7T7HHP9_9HYPH|nr:hypothetical protein [Martelella lutilitoris]QQM29347.1 hypothetical protein JET14_13540 [Martelella lutilitoris]